MMREFFEEIREEFVDFVEDYRELINKRPPRKGLKQKPAVIGGQLAAIRPASLFAERVENAIKIVFGVSIVLSAATSTFIGFASLSGLVEAFLENIFGRIALLVIGFSYVIVAAWKTLHLNHTPNR